MLCLVGALPSASWHSGRLWRSLLLPLTRYCREAIVSAVDQQGATETARLDRVLSCARTNAAPPSISGLYTLHAAVAGRERSHKTGLVHKIHVGGGASYPRRRDTKVD